MAINSVRLIVALIAVNPMFANSPPYFYSEGRFLVRGLVFDCGGPY